MALRKDEDDDRSSADEQRFPDAKVVKVEAMAQVSDVEAMAQVDVLDKSAPLI